MQIDSYDFGRLVVEGETYTSDVIIYPDKVVAGWWRREGHELCPADLGEVLEARPQVLVVGTGRFGRMRILPETADLLRERGIQLIALETGAACQRYNEMRGGTSRVVAALHLTC